MAVYRKIIAKLCLRIGISIPFIVLGYIASGGSIFGLFILVPMLIIAGLIIAPSLGELVAQPFYSILQPGERNPRAIPMYSRAQARRVEGKHREAMEEYEKIAASYTTELQPYLAMLEIAIVDLKDTSLADSILARGTAAFAKDAASLQILRQASKSLRERLAPKPEWYLKQKDRTLSIPGRKE